MKQIVLSGTLMKSAIHKNPKTKFKYKSNFPQTFRNSLQRPPSSQQQQFQSTRLIKNMDNSNGNRGHRDPHRDRGMMIRNRHYSGEKM